VAVPLMLKKDQQLYSHLLLSFCQVVILGNMVGSPDCFAFVVV
jgi:hypothetical protein